MKVTPQIQKVNLDKRDEMSLPKLSFCQKTNKFSPYIQYFLLHKQILTVLNVYHTYAPHVSDMLSYMMRCMLILDQE